MHTYKLHLNFEPFAVLVRCFVEAAELSESRLRDLFAGQQALNDRFGKCPVQRRALLKETLHWAKRAGFVRGCDEGVWSLTDEGNRKGTALVRANTCPFRHPRYLRPEWCGMVWPKSSQTFATR